ncbi:MAG TPA: LUD domain-containing protein [Anaerolineales bacterium]|nr:LUD domain-containing protein [Anaerolineales bacterium]
MLNLVTEKQLTPNDEFEELASEEQIERTVQALQANNIEALVAENAEEARRLFFERLPEGAEVFLGSSVTLETLGIKDEIDSSGRFNSLRTRMWSMDRTAQAREIRKIGAGPDYAAGSVHAVTENGQVLIASNTGSQLGPYASGAGKVIWVVGAQKIVRDLEEGFRRIAEYIVPLEEVQMQQLYNTHTHISKVLIVNKEIRPGRITMIIVKEELGY